MSFDDTNSTHSGMDPSESILVGIAYIIVSVAYIVPYIACIYIMHTDSGMSSSPLFHIVRHMGYCDVAQLALNGLPAGIFSILGTDRPFWLNKLSGAVLDAMWFVYVFLAQALAVNRFVHVFFQHRVNILLSLRNTEIIIGLCWFFGSFWFVALCCPGIDFFYSVEIASYLYGSSVASSVMIRINLYVDIVHSIFLIVWYAIIYVKVHLKMKTITANIRTTDDDKEKKLLLQACLLCFSDVLAVAAYMILQHMPNLVGHLLPIFINYTWIMCAGSNVIVYMFLNSLAITSSTLLEKMTHPPEHSLVRNGSSISKIKKRIRLMVFQGQFRAPPSTGKPTATKAVRPNQVNPS